MEKKVKEKKVKPLLAEKQAAVKEEVKIETSNVENEPKKYSYEELETIIKNLVEQHNNMRTKLLQYEELIASKRLDYLFAVMQHKECFTKEFVEVSSKEIEEALFIKTESVSE